MTTAEGPTRLPCTGSLRNSGLMPTRRAGRSRVSSVRSPRQAYSFREKYRLTHSPSDLLFTGNHEVMNALGQHAHSDLTRRFQLRTADLSPCCYSPTNRRLEIRHPGRHCYLWQHRRATCRVCTGRVHRSNLACKVCSTHCLLPSTTASLTAHPSVPSLALQLLAHGQDLSSSSHIHLARVDRLHLRHPRRTAFQHTKGDPSPLSFSDQRAR